MKVLIVSDAWEPQINGVVRTLKATAKELERQGHQILVAGPQTDRISTLALPFYREIKLELFARRRLARLLSDFAPDFIHIATEGPLGWAARSLCMKQSRPFTTSYHTRFPEYLAARAPQGLRRLTTYAAYAILRRFHAPAGSVMVATASIEEELRRRKFHRIVRWSRGVDMDLFSPDKNAPPECTALPRPLLLYVGRIAVEKNLEAFLKLQTTGSLIAVGDGPDSNRLRQQYPHAHFIGARQGEDLACFYAAADLFVFPSTTDTFGLVLLEACAAGLRVAAYPAPGPADIFAPPECHTFAVIGEDLQQTVDRALKLPADKTLPRTYAAHYSWKACAEQFFHNLQAPSPIAKRRLARWLRHIGEGI